MVKNWCNVLSMEGVTVCGHHPECRVTFGRGGPHIVWGEKEDLTQSYDKTPYTNRKFENQRTTHINATKNFDYTTIADRLRTVSWSNK